MSRFEDGRRNDNNIVTSLLHCLDSRSHKVVSSRMDSLMREMDRRLYIQFKKQSAKRVVESLKKSI